MKHRPSILLLGLSVVAGLTGCADDASDGTLSPELKADVQAILDDAVARQVTPGAVFHIASGDGDTWTAAAGVADLDANVAMGPDARFRAGSIMKTFVATAVLQAMEAGQLELDDAITEHLPREVTDRIADAESIEIWMLLDHRSGIADWVTPEIEMAAALDPEHVWSLDEILDEVERQGPMFEPGEHFSYSNSNYNLLGEILTSATGRSWRAVVRDDVIARAGLADTSVPEPGDRECPAPCAHGYFPYEGELYDFTRLDPSMAGASGGHALITTAADLTRFYRELRHGGLFRRDSTRVAMFAVLPARDTDEAMVAYGLGVSVLEVDGVTAIGHLGGTAGYQGGMLYVPETDRYVSGFHNVNADIASVLAPVLERVARP
jgi:D-alanyl-D-alanine carboxypeptidase